jgi:hypothetical protein
MGTRPPGPICSARVGTDWIDAGTLCRSRSTPPGPGDLGELLLKNLDPAKVAFDRDHTYSLAPEAARKRDIDLQIIGDDYKRSREITITSEAYLKELIRLGSGGKQSVSTAAKKIQFFIIRGGAEGFLSSAFAKLNAGDVSDQGESTGKKITTNRVDFNDVMAVFEPSGKLIRAVFLIRPLQIPGRWTARTANDIYNAWHNKEVSIYRNTSFLVPYLGLVVDDGMKKRGWVDIHKQEQTNGCIFITDPDTPALHTPELDTFEPKLIHEILATIGKTPDQVKGMIRLGIMKLVDI